MKKLAFTLLLGFVIVIHSSFGQQTVGLFQFDSTAFDGYTLLAPYSSKNTYLLNNCGHEIHSWASDYYPGAIAYLKPNGNLIRTAHIDNMVFDMAGGTGGRIEEFDWNGNLVWSLNLSTDSLSQHHDIELLPNGNILVLAWRLVDRQDAIKAGRVDLFPDETIWSETILELEPKKDSGATVVWRWDALDHVVQDKDPYKNNYGKISDHPELIDLNSILIGNKQDWLHFNSVDYNADLDQIVVSCHAFSEIYIIDHSTTSSQSGGHIGGKQDMGGDILYRYGNPVAYGRGTPADQVSFAQHDAQWIPNGYKNEGKIIFFNNGGSRQYSSIDMFTAPRDPDNGSYILNSGKPYSPTTPEWTYTADTPKQFFSVNMSGVHPLPNGHFFICESTKGHLFEIDENKKVVWDYVNPVSRFGPLKQGRLAFGVSVFRGYKYDVNDNAFKGKKIVDGEPLEQDPLPIFCDDTTGQGGSTGGGDTTGGVGIELLSTHNLNIYPNPCENVLNINNAEQLITHVEVYNIYGQTLLSQDASGAGIVLDLSAVKPGILYLKLYDHHHSVLHSTGIIKQ